MTRRLPIVALTSAALVLTACASGGDSSTTPSATDTAANANTTITLWLAGGDTPDTLRTYLQDTFKANTGATLTIEEQAWPDLVTKLTTALPDAENTPDVVELGNTQSPTFTNVGAFLDISKYYPALGGDKPLQPCFAAPGLDVLRVIFHDRRCSIGSGSREVDDINLCTQRASQHLADLPWNIGTVIVLVFDTVWMCGK